MQPRKTCPCLTERLLMGHNQIKQTNKQNKHSSDLPLILPIFVVMKMLPALKSAGYCKFINFRENSILQIALKDIFATLKIRGLVHDLTSSVKDRVISPIHEGFIFAKLRTRKVRENFRIYSILKSTSD